MALAGIPVPYPSQRLLGGAICSWSNPQEVEEMIFFGDCFKDRMPSGFSGPGWPRPAPRAPIVAERMWAGAVASSRDVLERVGCNYWEIPPPPPPSPPPTPGGQFSPMPGACRDSSGAVPHKRLDSNVHHNRSAPLTFGLCHAKCVALGLKCDALDIDGDNQTNPAKPLGWCAIWGNELTSADAGEDWLYVDTGTGGRACRGDTGSTSPSNTCWHRPPACQTPEH